MFWFWFTFTLPQQIVSKLLLINIIKHVTDEGDLVLDCFAGSGTLGKACIETSRKCILIEKEKKYCDYIKNSLKLTSDLLPINYQ